MKYKSSIPAFLFLLAGAAAHTHAQAPVQKHFNAYENRLPLAVFWEPSAFLSTYNNGTLRAGIEVPLLGDFGLSVAGSTYGGGQYGIKIAVKRYLNAINSYRGRGIFDNQCKRMYVGTEYFYKDHSYSVQDSLKGDRPITYDVSKYASSFSVIVGEVTNLRSGIYFEVYGGLGIRVKTVSNTLTQAQQDNLYHWHEGFVASFTDANADHQTGPHIVLSVRIGYRFL